MTQYIDKAAVVVEIEKRLDELLDLLPNASEVVKDNYTKDEANITGKYTALESFSKFLDTLEVKEVDLRKEFDFNKEIDEQIRLLGGVHKLDNNSKRWYTGTYEELFHFARHFFELGLKARKGL